MSDQVVETRADAEQQLRAHSDRRVVLEHRVHACDSLEHSASCFLSGEEEQPVDSDRSAAAISESAHDILERVRCARATAVDAWNAAHCALQQLLDFQVQSSHWRTFDYCLFMYSYTADEMSYSHVRVRFLVNSRRG